MRRRGEKGRSHRPALSPPCEERDEGGHSLFWAVSSPPGQSCTATYVRTHVVTPCMWFYTYRIEALQHIITEELLVKTRYTYI